LTNDRRKIFSVCNNLLDANLSATTTGRAHAHPQLVHALGQAFAYRADLLRTGDTLESVAPRTHHSVARVKQLITLTQLAPRVLRAALTAGLPPRLTVSNLIEVAQQLDWRQQKTLLGLAKKP